MGHRLWTALQVLDQRIPSDLAAGASTASVTVFDGRGSLITATVGGGLSFAVTYDKEGAVRKVVSLSGWMHQPKDPAEKRRIEGAGGHVREDGSHYVSERTHKSRVLGYHDLGDIVPSEASISLTNNTDMGEYSRMQLIVVNDRFFQRLGVVEVQEKEEYLTTLLNNFSSSDRPLAEYLVENTVDPDAVVSIQEVVADIPFLLATFDDQSREQVSHHAAEHIGAVFGEQCKLAQEDYETNPLSVAKKITSYCRDHHSAIASSGVWLPSPKDSNVKTIKIPEGFNYIGVEACQGYINLKEVIFNKSIIEIGDGAFSGCKKLKKIVFSSTVTKIGHAAFNQCTALEELIFPEGLTTIGKSAFFGCPIKNLRLPRGLTKIESVAFALCDCLESVVMHSNVTEISKDAFALCDKLEKISIVLTEEKEEEKQRLLNLFPDELQAKIEFVKEDFYLEPVEPKPVFDPLHALGTILTELKSDIQKEPLDTFRKLAKNTHGDLHRELEQFKKAGERDQDSLRGLQLKLSGIIKEALPQFDKAPSLFKAFQNALIMIANFFRKLVGATQIGLFRPGINKDLEKAQVKIDEVKIDQLSNSPKPGSLG